MLVMVMMRPERCAQHRPQRGAREEEGAAQVGLDRLVPFLVRHADEEVVGRPAGVVDQDVDLAEALHRLVDRRSAPSPLADVALDQHGLAAELL